MYSSSRTAASSFSRKLLAIIVSIVLIGTMMNVASIANAVEQIEVEEQPEAQSAETNLTTDATQEAVDEVDLQADDAIADEAVEDTVASDEAVPTDAVLAEETPIQEQEEASVPEEDFVQLADEVDGSEYATMSVPDLSGGNELTVEDLKWKMLDKEGGVLVDGDNLPTEPVTVNPWSYFGMVYNFEISNGGGLIRNGDYVTFSIKANNYMKFVEFLGLNENGVAFNGTIDGQQVPIGKFWIEVPGKDNGDWTESKITIVFDNIPDNTTGISNCKIESARDYRFWNWDNEQKESVLTIDDVDVKFSINPYNPSGPGPGERPNNTIDKWGGYEGGNDGSQLTYEGRWTLSTGEDLGNSLINSGGSSLKVKNESGQDVAIDATNGAFYVIDNIPANQYVQSIDPSDFEFYIFTPFAFQRENGDWYAGTYGDMSIEGTDVNFLSQFTLVSQASDAESFDSFYSRVMGASFQYGVWHDKNAVGTATEWSVIVNFGNPVTQAGGPKYTHDQLLEWAINKSNNRWQNKSKDMNGGTALSGDALKTFIEADDEFKHVEESVLTNSVTNGTPVWWRVTFAAWYDSDKTMGDSSYTKKNTFDRHIGGTSTTSKSGSIAFKNASGSGSLKITEGALAVYKAVGGIADADKTTNVIEQEFAFTLSVCDTSSSNPSDYTPVTGKSYKLQTKDGTAISDGTTNTTSGIFMLKDGQRALFEGLDLSKYYMVQEVGGDTEKNIEGFTFSGTTHEVEKIIKEGQGLSRETIELKTDGDLTSGFKIDSDSQIDVSFSNDYETPSTPSAEIVINGIKTVDGQTPGSKTFTFELWETESDFSTVIGNAVGTTTNGSDGAFEFSPLTYTAADAGTHYYIVKEVDPGDGAYIYDGSVAKVTVVVDATGNATIASVTNPVSTSYTSNDDSRLFDPTLTYKMKEEQNRGPWAIFILEDSEGNEIEAICAQSELEGPTIGSDLVTTGKNSKLSELAFVLRAESGGLSLSQFNTLLGLNCSAVDRAQLMQCLVWGYSILDKNGSALNHAIEASGRVETMYRALIGNNKMPKLVADDYEFPALNAAYENGKVTVTRTGYKAEGAVTTTLSWNNSNVTVDGVTNGGAVTLDTSYNVNVPAGEAVTFTVAEKTSNGDVVKYLMQDTLDGSILSNGNDAEQDVQIAFARFGSIGATLTVGGMGEGITFNNTSHTTPPGPQPTYAGNVTFGGTKTIRGANATNESFEFNVYDAERSGLTWTQGPLKDTQYTTGAGTFTFDEITYSATDLAALTATNPVSFYYIVKEAPGNTANWTYDESVYGVEVIVSIDPDDPTKTVSNTKVYKKIGDLFVYGTGTFVAFENTYDEPNEPDVEKVVVDKDGTKGDYDELAAFDEPFSYELTYKFIGVDTTQYSKIQFVDDLNTVFCQDGCSTPVSSAEVIEFVKGSVAITEYDSDGNEIRSIDPEGSFGVLDWSEDNEAFTYTIDDPASIAAMADNYYVVTVNAKVKEGADAASKIAQHFGNDSKADAIPNETTLLAFQVNNDYSKTTEPVYVIPPRILKVTKHVNALGGVNASGKTYAFTLTKDGSPVTNAEYTVDGIAAGTTDGEGTFSIAADETAVFTLGSGTYVVTENATTIDGSVLTISHAVNAEPVVISDTAAGIDLETAWSSEVIFTNTYTPTDAPHSMTVQKLVEGNAAPDYTQEYYFVVVDADHNPVAGLVYSIGGQTFQTDGEGVFILHASEVAFFENLTADQDYTIWEIKVPPYEGVSAQVKNVLDGIESTFSIVSGVITIKDDGGHLVTFTNTYNPGLGGDEGALNVTKSVLDKEGLVPNGKEYRFTISDSAGSPLVGQPYYVGYNMMRTGDGGSFTLKNGETAVFTNLKENEPYTITEDMDSRSVDGVVCKTFVVVAQGSVQEATSATAEATDENVGTSIVFTNSYASPDNPDGPEVPEQPNRPDVPEQPNGPDQPNTPKGSTDNPSPGTNTGKKAPLTGDPLADTMILLCAVAVLSGLALFIGATRRKDSKV